MYALIDIEKEKIFGVCNKKPNLEDLESRGQTAVKFNNINSRNYKDCEPVIDNGEVIKIEKKEE